MDGIEGPRHEEIIARQFGRWFKADQKLGAGLGVSVNGADASSNGKGSHYAPPAPLDKVPHGAQLSPALRQIAKSPSAGADGDFLCEIELALVF